MASSASNGNRIDPTTSRYLARVQAEPLLDREREVALARAFRDHGDQAAGDRVIAANLRQVVITALRYRSLGIALDELIAQGNLGLVTALRRFDPERGVRFATYANHWIRAEMLGLALQQRSMVGGGRGPLGSRYVFRMRRLHGALLTQLGDCPRVLDLLSERFGKTPSELHDILQRIDRRDASFEQPGGEDGARSLADTLRDDAATGADDFAARRAAQGTLEHAVARATADLSTRERYILEHRLLADEETRLPLSEIGRSFGVSRERARQLEQAVRTKLRTRLNDTVSQLGVASAA
jgi:RNA polymerase sigma-32 factor